MKNELNSKEVKLMKTVRDEWLNNFNSLKFDEKEAIKFNKWLYNISGLGVPKVIIFDSPLACQFGANILKYDEVGNKVGNKVRNEVRNEVRNKVGNEVRNEVENKVGNEVRNEVWNEVGNKVENKVWNKVRNEVENKVGNEVRNEVENKVWNEVENKVWNEVKEYFAFSYYGNYSDYGWVSYYDYFTRIGIINNKNFNTFSKGIKSNCFMSIQLDKAVLISKPPISINRDDTGRMHCLTDYAVKFADGYGQNYLNGVFIELELFEKFKNKTLTVKELLSIRNAEQKAVLIKYFGYDKVLKEVDAKIVDKLTYKVNGIKRTTDKLLSFMLDDFEVKLLELKDSSTDSKYFIGVPFSIKTVIEGKCWISGCNPENEVIKYEVEA